MATDKSAAKLQVLQQVISALEKLEAEDRDNVLQTVATYFHSGAVTSPHRLTVSSSIPRFSEDLDLSPKEFLLEKQPRTDVERIACLAYYLTHYRDTPHFKTLDLNKLNTEAAQPKFTNASYATNNAVKRGYLASAPGGHKQLSAPGEQFVRALPDREAAKAAMAKLRPKRRRASRRRSTPSQEK